MMCIGAGVDGNTETNKDEPRRRGAPIFVVFILLYINTIFCKVRREKSLDIDILNNDASRVCCVLLLCLCFSASQACLALRRRVVCCPFSLRDGDMRSASLLFVRVPVCVWLCKFFFWCCAVCAVLLFFYVCLRLLTTYDVNVNVYDVRCTTYRCTPNNKNKKHTATPNLYMYLLVL